MVEGRRKELIQLYYRFKINNAKLYEQIWNVYKPFTTRERLQECLRPFDTQQNEAMNKSVPKYTPKSKTYSMTISLTNRVMVFVGISNLTAETYWGKVCLTLSITMATETISFLKSQDTSRFYNKMYRARTNIKVRERKITTLK